MSWMKTIFTRTFNPHLADNPTIRDWKCTMLSRIIVLALVGCCAVACRRSNYTDTSPRYEPGQYEIVPISSDFADFAVLNNVEGLITVYHCTSNGVHTVTPKPPDIAETQQLLKKFGVD